MSGTAASQATRKQLDDLDALLQKMLALPINQLDDPPPRQPQLTQERPDYTTPAESPPTNGVRPELPKAAFFSSSTTLPPSQPITAEPQLPKTEVIAKPWAIDLNPRQGSSVLGSSSPTASSAPDDAFKAAPEVTIETPPAVMPFRLPAIPPTISAVTDEQPSDAGYGRVNWKLWPVLGINLVYDWVMPAFGERGRWLTTPSGRNLMGGCGILMLIASLAYGGIDVIRWPR